MGVITFFFIFLSASRMLNANSVSVCVNDCVCSVITKTNEDVHGEVINCSYNANILNSNLSLPPSVYSLDLASNNLTRIVVSKVLKSPTMIELYLNHNSITEIEVNALQLPELRTLDLSDNRLEAIQEDIFRRLKKLERLDLANNRFTTFTNLAFHHLSELKAIILDNNNIGSALLNSNIFDRNGFGLTHKIKEISISGISLHTVTDNLFVDAYDLKKLTISKNNLSDTFQIPYTLEYLDMSDNPITYISIEDFIDLPGLKELKLNGLQISEVEEFVFSPLKGLISLELERNKNLIKFSPIAFGADTLDDPDEFELRSLSLKNSGLKSLNKDLLVIFGQLLRLDLQGNPWACDCNLLWLKKLQIAPNDYEYLRCAEPTSLYNKKIFEVNSKLFRCERDHKVGLTIGLIAFCVLSTFIALWIYFCVPRYQSRSTALQNIHGSSAAYSILPLQAT